FFQAEDGIRDRNVTGVQTCALPIYSDAVLICVPTPLRKSKDPDISYVIAAAKEAAAHFHPGQLIILESTTYPGTTEELLQPLFQIGRASCRERVYISVVAESAKKKQ